MNTTILLHQKEEKCFKKILILSNEDDYAEWWAHLGLNQGPTGYEPAALTAEL